MKNQNRAVGTVRSATVNSAELSPIVFELKNPGEKQKIVLCELYTCRMIIINHHNNCNID